MLVIIQTWGILYKIKNKISLKIEVFVCFEKYLTKSVFCDIICYIFDEEVFMVNIAPLVAATAALNAATAANISAANARRKKGGRYVSAEVLKKNEEYNENQEALSLDYEKAYTRAQASIDKSKTKIEDSGGIEAVYSYYDSQGNLLIRENLLRFSVDRETTTEIYSPYTGKKVFSCRLYEDSCNQIESIYHYDKDGNDDTNVYLKKKQLEAKRDKQKARKRLFNMKLNRILGKNR